MPACDSLRGCCGCKVNIFVFFFFFSPRQWWSTRLPTWDTLNTTWRPRSMKRLPKRFPGAQRRQQVSGTCPGWWRGWWSHSSEVSSPPVWVLKWGVLHQLNGSFSVAQLEPWSSSSSSWSEQPRCQFQHFFTPTLSPSLSFLPGQGKQISRYPHSCL